MIDEYKVKPEYLLLAKSGHLQANINATKYPDPADKAARRIFDRITKSKGTIVAVHVKNPQFKVD